MAVPEEPPPIRVRSDLQASLAGWSFCPFKATFGSAHWTSLGVWAYPALWRGEGESRTLLASSSSASKEAETKATGSGAKRDG